MARKKRNISTDRIRDGSRKASLKDDPADAKKSTATDKLLLVPVEETNHHNINMVDKVSRLILASQAGSILSTEETLGISEAVLESDNQIEALCDFLVDMTVDEASDVMRRALSVEDMNDDGESSSPAEKEEAYDDDDDDDNSIQSCDSNESNDAASYLQQGECELCEREMKLTRHHLIPKVTWKYMITRFLNAGPSYQNADFDTVREILDLGDTFPLPTNAKVYTSRIQAKLFVSSYCANLCRPCHSCIHGNIDHKLMAERFNTVDDLLKNEKVYSFCNWARKQRAGKYRNTR
mmetsp:Transcript_10134/g.15288  ORF Transcript_10134/g.15288 Transcript_10134/m.15288 type:complete len:294 (-) Transcript_10134:245-1126(-)|eukprot:CAMPEP_0194107154 /NCGR_PEP_ID=MMETSP0150-20130528/7058_1 /TAXON_ID=122233 /ORGANISM="Chaetoceros debilis, Strain MM31A-1" /LENGTH=293 /DNA_ID=CAMNT_0038795463 /DNA_START=34 /DNA_END=915 /DNA_ORIENTATION=+